MDHSAFLDGPADHSAFLNGPASNTNPSAGSISHSAFEPTSVPSIFHFLLQSDLSKASPYDPLALIAKGGQTVNNLAQKAAGSIAESAGKTATEEGSPEIPLPKSLGGSVNASALPAVLGATALGTASEATMPQNRLAAGLTLAGPAIKLAGKGVDALKAAVSEPAVANEIEGVAQAASKKPGLLAQIIQSKGGRWISPGEAQYAIEHPEVLDEAKSIPEANSAYKDAIGDLKGKAQSLGQRLNKTIIRTGDYDEAINRTGRMLNGTEINPATGEAIPLTPQDALEGVQSINQALRDKMFTSQMPDDQVREVLKVKDGLMDYLQNNGTPKLKEAAQDLFKAHVKDAFSDWLPRNKYGTTDVWRSITSARDLALGTGAVLSGHPVAAAPLVANSVLSSPKVLGQLVKEVAAAPQVGTALNAMKVPLANMASDNTPEPPENPMAWLGVNTINLSKSGNSGKELSGLKIPGVNKGSGGQSLQNFADRFFKGDDNDAITYLKQQARQQ